MFLIISVVLIGLLYHGILWNNSRAAQQSGGLLIDEQSVRDISFNGHTYVIGDENVIRQIIKMVNDHHGLEQLPRPAEAFFGTPNLFIEQQDGHVSIQTNIVQDWNYPHLYVEYRSGDSTDFYLMKHPDLNNFIIQGDRLIREERIKGSDDEKQLLQF